MWSVEVSLHAVTVPIKRRSLTGRKSDRKRRGAPKVTTASEDEFQSEQLHLRRHAQIHCGF